MPGVFDSDIETAQELIAEFGQVCFWRKPAPAVASLVPGYPTDGVAPAPVECRIAFFAPKDLNRGVAQFLDMMPGTEVPDNTEIGLLAGGLAFTPENTDMISRGDIAVDPISIMKIDLLAPNGTPVLYYITVAA